MDLVISNKGIGYFNSYILERIKNNKNFIACVTGQTGSGKSFSALREGELLDPDFDIRNVAFTPQEFMDLVNGKTKELKRGSFILYDEVQVTMSHLDYQTLQSKLINYVLQTFRHRGFILFMTSPHFSFINASARKLFHSRMETVSIDYDKKTCTIKPFLLQTNQENGMVYRKYLRIYVKGEGVLPYRVMKVSLPSKGLIKDYEDKKNQFTKQLNESISNDLKKLNEPKQRRQLTLQQREIVVRLANKMTIPKISEDLGVSINTIYSHIELIRKKGIEITPVKEGQEVIHYEVKGFEEI